MIYISLINRNQKNINIMVDHIIDKNPVKLYPIDNKYNYTFLKKFKEYYDTQSIYDLLNYTKLNNLLYTIYLNWYNLKNKSKNNKIYYKYDCKPEEFNNIIKNFIDDDYSISIFTINSIIKYYL